MRLDPVPFGKYSLLDRVNTGGMAEVFRAKAFGVAGFERVVAVKRILPTIAADTEFITMFIDEAKLAVQLNHANIAQIFDLGKVDDSYFIALEYIHGKDLRAVFNRARDFGETLPIALACYVMMKICEGLDYAHTKRDASGRELGLVHRDVSPQNMLISFDGDVKLIDFGIAKAVGKASRTRTGILKGKFGYLSPEQVRGEEVDRRSDVFGVGIVLWELLSGERLFLGDSDFSTLEKVRAVEIPSLRAYNPEVPVGLERIVLRALARDRDVRYQTALELHDALQDFLHAYGEPFGRKELSGWMLTHFPADAIRDPEELGDLEEEDSLASSPIDLTPIVERTESSAVYEETREAPEEAKPKHKSTLLGIPAVLPSAAGLPSQPARSHVPPPPPPRVAMGVTSSRPPAPPGTGTGRYLPPPPRTQPPAPAFADDDGPFALPAPIASTTQPPPIPGSVAPAVRTPQLSMDWDDEDLSTQIYDRPTDLNELYESIEASFDPPAAPAVAPPTHPPATHPPAMYGAPRPTSGYTSLSTHSPFGSMPAEGTPPPSVHVSPRAFTKSEPPPARVEPAGSLRAPPLAPSMTMGGTERPFERGRNPVYAALAVAAVVLLCFVGYVFLARTEPGTVQLTTQPTDATLLFDGAQVGNGSPFVITGVSPNDKHLLQVQRAGYRTWQQEVQVQAGQTLQFPVTLQPESASEATSAVGASQQGATGGFSIETTPPGAAVLLDGRELSGVTPLRVGNLLARRYEVRARLPGFREYRTRIEVRAGTEHAMPRIVLEPERVRVRVTSEPAGAEASVVRGSERRALGRTPVDVTLENDGSPWTVEIAKGGYEPYLEPINIEGGAAELAVRGILQRRASADHEHGDSSAPRASAPRPPEGEGSAAGGQPPGVLRINSRPWSQITVDGQLIGNTPQMSISLAPGTHRVTLVNPEFNLRKNLTVSIKSGETETQIVTLQ